MTDRELLLYLYGYLNGVLNMSNISSDKISNLKEIILLQQERNKAKLEVKTTDNEFEETITDDEFEEEYRRDFFREENNSSDNDKYYNENLDLDQQDPDFYC